MKELQEIHRAAVALVSATLCEPACRHIERDLCLEAERKRPLTQEERAAGWCMRPVSAYDQARLCDPCLAYWHACLAEQALARVIAQQQYDEAQARIDEVDAAASEGVAS